METMDAIWVRRIGNTDVRWFAPPAGMDGSFPFVAAADVIVQLTADTAAVAGYLLAAQAEPLVGAVEIMSDDGPLLLVPHDHAKAVFMAGIAAGNTTEDVLEDYLSGAESALYVHLAPMKRSRRERWLTAFRAKCIANGVNPSQEQA